MKNEQGYTVTELLAVLIISSLIIGFCFTTYLFGQRLYSSWNKKADLTALVNKIHQNAVLDVERSKKIEFTDEGILMQQLGGRVVQYRISADSLMRNDVLLSNSSVQKIILQITEQDNHYQINTSLQSVILQRRIISSAEMFPSSKREFLQALNEIKNKY